MGVRAIRSALTPNLLWSPPGEVKSVHETTKEKGLLKELLRTQKYSPVRKYCLGDVGVAYEPMAYKDVRPDPPRGYPSPCCQRLRARPGP